MKKRVVNLDDKLLNTILVNINKFKNSKECPEFVQELGRTSRQLRKDIVRNAAINTETLKMRIGF